MTSANEFPTKLRNRRTMHGTTQAEGDYSLADLRDDLIATGIPRRYVPSVSTLSRMETGKVPESKVDAIVIYGMARVYSCGVSELSEAAANELDTMRDLLEHAWP